MATLIQAWGAIRATLKTFEFSEIKTILGLAGFDLNEISHLEQAPKEGASKGTLLSRIDMVFGQMDEGEQKRFMMILTEEILLRKPEMESQLESHLSRLGWSIIQGVLLPIQLFDRDDVENISEAPLLEMVKAAQRFRDGDLSGAISAACGAVDIVTARVYAEKDIGDPGEASFQERCKKSLNSMNVDGNLQRDLREIGWNQKDIDMFNDNFTGALNRGSFVMQSLRSKMGDVHGTKPVLKALVFDSIKWALIMIRTIESSHAMPVTE